MDLRSAGTVNHMKTTLVIHDVVMKRLKEEAARRGTTISELVESAIRLFLDEVDRAEERELPPLPTYEGGELLVDVSDREALDRIFDEDSGW